MAIGHKLRERMHPPTPSKRRPTNSALASCGHACALAYLRTPLLVDRRCAAQLLACLILCLCWEWCKPRRWLGYFGATSRKTGESPWSLSQGSVRSRQASDDDCFRPTSIYQLQVNSCQQPQGLQSTCCRTKAVCLKSGSHQCLASISIRMYSHRCFLCADAGSTQQLTHAIP